MTNLEIEQVQALADFETDATAKVFNQVFGMMHGPTLWKRFSDNDCSILPVWKTLDLHNRYRVLHYLNGGT